MIDEPIQILVPSFTLSIHSRQCPLVKRYRCQKPARDVPPTLSRARRLPRQNAGLRLSGRLGRTLGVLGNGRHGIVWELFVVDNMHPGSQAVGKAERSCG